jgi:uncharacterized membrane protein (UPF0127 family)
MACFSGTVLCLLLAACSERSIASDELNTRLLTFPNGQKVRAEFVSHPKDVMRGMKYRDSLAPDRGMLFQHGREGLFRYWMYEVRIPLDIIWLDSRGVIVQVVHNAPPCPGPQEKCPSYGGAFKAIQVLELAAGAATKNALKPGMRLDY